MAKKSKSNSTGNTAVRRSTRRRRSPRADVSSHQEDVDDETNTNPTTNENEEEQGTEEEPADAEQASFSNNGTNNERRVAARTATMRAVADREAARLARPERRVNVGPLAHASKLKSGVTSTPSGLNGNHFGRLFGGGGGTQRASATADGSAEAEAWCGPFSVARQMIAAREEAKAKREAELAEKEREENGTPNGEPEHPLDSMVREVQLKLKRKMNPSMRWKANVVTDNDDNSPAKIGGSSNKDNLYVKRQKRLLRQQSSGGACSLGGDDEDLPHSHHKGGRRRVKSLFELCVDFLVDNFDQVESLGSAVDCSIRTKICRALVASHKFTSEAFEALAEPGIEALELVDCACVTQDQLANALRKCLPLGLTGLILDHAGRCFGPRTVQAIVDTVTTTSSAVAEDSNVAMITPTFATSTASLSTAVPTSLMSNYPSSLMALSIGGAYLLSDADAARLIRYTCRTLHSIEFKACPLLGSQFAEAIGECYGEERSDGMKEDEKETRKVVEFKAETPLLELSLQDVPLTKDAYVNSLAKSGALKHVRNLKLHHLTELDDGVVESLLHSISNCYNADDTCVIEGIDLSHNIDLTDEVLAPIRRCNRNSTLQSLVLTGLKNLTSIGLEALFTRDLEGMPNPPTLRRLDLGECGEDSVNDQVIELAVSLASRKVDSLRNDDTTSASNNNDKDTTQKEDHQHGKSDDGVDAKGDKDDKKEKVIVNMDANEDEDGDDNGDGGDIRDVVSSENVLVGAGGGGLVYLNLNGAVGITDKSMEHIAQHCSTSLHDLDVSFCPHVTNQGLGYLLSQVHDQLTTLKVWGCAQLSDIFFDGHRRVLDSTFDIEGAWMKKTTATTTSAATY